MQSLLLHCYNDFPLEFEIKIQKHRLKQMTYAKSIDHLFFTCKILKYKETQPEKFKRLFRWKRLHLPVCVF